MASKGSCIKYGYQTYVPFSQNNTLDALCKEMKEFTTLENSLIIFANEFGNDDFRAGQQMPSIQQKIRIQKH
jgi:hypothetical protein